MRGLTADIRENGVVRAFEPRKEWNGGGPNERWKCRGRAASPHIASDGKPRATRQCNSVIAPGQVFCGKCGGLIAWGGEVEYKGQRLRHLDRGVA